MKKICFIFSLLGIISILAIVNFTEPKIIQISSINSKYLEKTIKITGQITSVKVTETNFTIFNVKDQAKEITAVCDCPNIKKGQRIELTGRVEEYKNQMQIIADKVVLVK